MRMLAIECATEACSLALFDGGRLVDSRHEVLGRGHAEQLVPLIASLPDKGRALEIRVSLGPGSFTGVRIGLAAARALGLAWGAPVRGYPTLALVAAMARHEAAGPVSVCMAGGHGEWFVQDFAGDGLPQNEVHSTAPEASRGRWKHPVIAGNRAVEKAALEAGDHRALDFLPDARFVPGLPDALLTSVLTPIYGRGPDARLPG
jgi:tRNA threonylcarbamoyl adenosine modification protein YeaZ